MNPSLASNKLPPMDTYQFILQRLCPQLQAFPELAANIFPTLQNLFNHHDLQACDCFSTDSDEFDPRWCPNAPCQAAQRSSEMLELILPELRRAKFPSGPFDTILREAEERAKALRIRKAILDRTRRRTLAWVESMADDNDDEVPTMATDMAPSHQPLPSTSIQSLPLELLSIILLYAQGTNPRAMLLFSQVNRAFWNATRSTPRLWSHINIRHNHHITKLQLERSGAVLLDVSMSLPPIITGDEGTARLADFIAYLTPHHHRIRSLDAIHPYKSWVRRSLALVASANLPQLKALDVGLSRTISPDFVWIPMFSERAEQEPERTSPQELNLTTISLCHVAVNTQSAFLSPSIRSLTVKYSVFSSYSILVAALQAMPGLQSLHLEFLRFSRAERFQNPHLIELPNLRELALVGIGLTQVSNQLLGNLQPPALTSLTLTHWEQEFTETGFHELGEEEDHEAEWALYELFRRTPELRQLELLHFNLSRDSWRNALHLLPKSVTHLRLSRCSFPAANMFQWVFGPVPPEDSDCSCQYCHSEHDLVSGRSGQSPCPNLSHLTIESEEHISSKMVRMALVARSKNGDAGRLASLTITGWLASNVALGDLDVIREHVDDLKIGVIVDQDVAFVSDRDMEAAGSDGEASESSAEFSGTDQGSRGACSAMDEEGDQRSASSDDERVLQSVESGLDDSNQADEDYIGSDHDEVPGTEPDSTSTSLPRSPTVEEEPSVPAMVEVTDAASSQEMDYDDYDHWNDEEEEEESSDSEDERLMRKKRRAERPVTLDWDGSVYSDSCSESWASGDEVIAEGRLPFQYAA